MILPRPSPVELKEVEWVVLTEDTTPEESDWVFVALSPSDYERLSLNQAELLRWITEANWQLDYYTE